MSFNFEAKSLVIPEGKVMKIIDSNNNIIWQSTESFNYVSLGDSIAAGHSIDDNWEKNYGTRSQYGGENGNSSTIIVPNSYTDLISKSGYMGNTISFARSGDTVRDLINKLDDNKVISALKGADYVTICIGANDVL
jgi:lysophospholipase L1-like esterase